MICSIQLGSWTHQYSRSDKIRLKPAFYDYLLQNLLRYEHINFKNQKIQYSETLSVSAVSHVQNFQSHDGGFFQRASIFGRGWRKSPSLYYVSRTTPGENLHKFFQIDSGPVEMGGKRRAILAP